MKRPSKVPEAEASSKPPIHHAAWVHCYNNNNKPSTPEFPPFGKPAVAITGLDSPPTSPLRERDLRRVCQVVDCFAACLVFLSVVTLHHLPSTVLYVAALCGSATAVFNICATVVGLFNFLESFAPGKKLTLPSLRTTMAMIADALFSVTLWFVYILNCWLAPSAGVVAHVFVIMCELTLVAYAAVFLYSSMLSEAALDGSK